MSPSYCPFKYTFTANTVLTLDQSTLLFKAKSAATTEALDLAKDYTITVTVITHDLGAQLATTVSQDFTLRLTNPCLASSFTATSQFAITIPGDKISYSVYDADKVIALPDSLWVSSDQTATCPELQYIFVEKATDSLLDSSIYR